MEIAPEAEFLDPLRVQHVEGPWWELTDSLRYWSEYTQEEIVVPNGFVTDFASVPRLPVVYLLFGSIADRPAVVHDFCYRMKDFSRWVSDSVFLEAMEVDGYDSITASTMFTGVRLGGWYSYDDEEGRLDPR